VYTLLDLNQVFAQVMEIIYKNFSKYKDKFGERLSRFVKGMMAAGKANTNKIAEEIAKVDKINQIQPGCLSIVY
jgi:hypothetical protein